MAKTLTKKEGNRERVRAHRQREKDRAKLMAMFSAAAPEGIEDHIHYRLAVEDGEPRLVWNLDEAGAAFINEFAANIDGLSVDPKAVMRELSLHIGKKLIRRAYDEQKGEKHG